MFKKLFYVFKNWGNIDYVLQEYDQKIKDQIRESKKYNLNLCFKHRERSPGTHYSDHNCHFCVETERVEFLERQLSIQKESLEKEKQRNGLKTS